jgi:hypothetical protein
MLAVMAELIRARVTTMLVAAARLVVQAQVAMVLDRAVEDRATQVQAVQAAAVARLVANTVATVMRVQK